MPKKKIDYVVVWVMSMDLNEALDELRKRISEDIEEEYELLGGASIVIEDGRFLVSQTLTKEARP